MGFTPFFRRARSQWATIAVAVIAALFASVFVSIPAPAHALSDTGTGGQFVPLQQRVFDSRNTTWGNAASPVKNGVWTTIPVAGSNGIPADASAVQATLTEVDASGSGVVYADKTGASTPNTSMPYLTWYDTNVSNSAMLALGDDGGIQVSTNVTSMNLIVDVQGYYTSGDPTAGGYVPLTTATRAWSSGTTKYATNATVDVAIGGQAGVPSNASSAMINIIESGSTSGADGYLVPYAAGSTAPTYSSMNWTSGQNAEFSVPVKLGTNGKVTIKIKAGGSVALSVGIQGYFTATDGTAVLTPAHTRVYDSRSTAPVAQVAAGGTRKIQVAGVAGVPGMGSGLTAAAVNIYVLSGSTSGHVNVAADDAAMGDDAQQFYTNRITYGFTTVRLGADGGINLKNYASTPIDVLVDVEGWFTNPLAPQISCQPGFDDNSWTKALPSSPISCSISANPAANSSDTLQYGVDLSEDVAPVNVALPPSAATTVPVQVSPTPGTHEIWAATESDDGDSTETVYSFDLGDWTTDGFTSAPADGETTSLVPNLTIQLAGNYVLPNDAQMTYFVSTDTAGTNVVWSGAGDDSTGVQPTGLSAQTYYWWAVITGSVSPDGTQGTVTTPVRSLVASDDAAGEGPSTTTADSEPDWTTSTNTGETSTSSNASTQLRTLSYTPVPGCGASARPSQGIQEYPRVHFNGVVKGGHANLLCGTPGTKGMRHIWIGPNNHSAKYEQIVDTYPIGLTAAQFMRQAAGTTLDAPRNVVYRASNDTYTYSSPVQIKHKNKVVKTYTSYVSVADGSWDIITAYVN